MNKSWGLMWLCAGLTVAAAQDKQDNEVIELSSFALTSDYDRSYAPVAPAKPTVAIALRKRADAVVMDITLLNNADKAEERNRDIYATIKALQKAVGAVPGLEFERREIQLRGEARRKTVFSRSSATSYANVAVVAPLAADSDLFALVDRMRSVVSLVTPSGVTKVQDGAVALVLRNPDQYRRELLSAVFADLAFVKENLGPGFEVLPSGLDGVLKTRAASEREVELWIDYRFMIRSTLELTHPRAEK